MRIPMLAEVASREALDQGLAATKGAHAKREIKEADLGLRAGDDAHSHT